MMLGAPPSSPCSQDELTGFQLHAPVSAAAVHQRTVKGALCRFGQEIQNIKEVIIQTQGYLSFPSLNKQALLRGKQEGWQGPPHKNKVQQYETVKVGLFVQP